MWSWIKKNSKGYAIWKQWRYISKLGPGPLVFSYVMKDYALLMTFGNSNLDIV